MESATVGTPTPEFRQSLYAILAADGAAFTRLMAANERGTITALDAARAVFRSEIEKRGGRVVDMAGDSVLAVFGAAADAVDVSIAVQTALLKHALAEAEDRRLLFRIGVHLGDIMTKPDGTVYGDGVNVAARLQSLAPPGGIVVSQLLRASIGSACEVRFRDLGERTLKGVPRPVRVLLVDEKTVIAAQHLVPQDSAARALGNLPVHFTSFLGRERALAEVIVLLAEHRLVTLLGMGGLGKTRLAVETAAHAGSDFPDGTWFVDLAAVTDAEAVVLAAAGVFGIANQAGKSIEASLVDALSGRRLLIVLDNCEHVTAAAASLAHALLAACPQVKIIATSREVLAISGEHVWPIRPLPCDGDTTPAVQLFLERAGAVAPDFVLGDQGEVISHLCRALDGIPLAIELAAARVRSMSPAQILERINQRFRLLTGGSGAAPRARHQTLRNAVQWSFDLLSPSEQAVVTRVAVFAGGFTLEAAERVCAAGDVDALDVCDQVSSLVNKSLLQVERPRGDVRFAMLETIRSFCLDKLEAAGELAALRQRHAAFFADQADTYFEYWRSPREREAYRWLDLEIHNLREAFQWARTNGDIDSAARIASDVGDMGRFRLREEAPNWAEEVLEQAREVRHARLAVLLTWCASSAWASGRFEEAKRFGEEAISLCEDPAFAPFVWAYGDLAFVALFDGDVTRAIDLLRAGAEHPTDQRDRFMMAFHLYVLATAGFAEQAAQSADQVVQQVDIAGVPMAIAVAYGAKGAALEGTDPTGALAAYEHAIEVARSAGTRFMEALIAPRVAALSARSGEPVAALRGFERMLASFGGATDLASVSAWRASLVVLLAKLGRFDASATLYGTFAALIDASGVVPELPPLVEQARGALGDAAFAAAVSHGGALSLREATDYAIAQIRLALNELSVR